MLLWYRWVWLEKNGDMKEQNILTKQHRFVLAWFGLVLYEVWFGPVLILHEVWLAWLGGLKCDGMVLSKAQQDWGSHQLIYSKRWKLNPKSNVCTLLIEKDAPKGVYF